MEHISKNISQLKRKEGKGRGAGGERKRHPFKKGCFYIFESNFRGGFFVLRHKTKSISAQVGSLSNNTASLNVNLNVSRRHPACSSTPQTKTKESSP